MILPLSLVLILIATRVVPRRQPWQVQPHSASMFSSSTFHPLNSTSLNYRYIPYCFLVQYLHRVHYVNCLGRF